MEKQLKAALTGCNVQFTWTYDAKHLLGLLANVMPNLATKINAKYLARLTQIYNYRYFDDTKSSIIGKLNFTLSRVFYLSELDYSFSILERASTLTEPNNEQMESGYDFDIQHKTSSLYLNNYILLNKDKAEIFDGQDLITQSAIIDGIELYTAADLRPTNNFYHDFEMDGIKINGAEMTAITP